MRTALRIVAVLGAVAVVAIVAVAIAIATVDVNAFSGLIRDRVKEATGRELTMGTIALKRSLTPTLTLNDVSLANAPWGKEPALVAAREVEIDVALLPLMQRQLEVGRIVLVEPAIALETDGRGRGNWRIERGQQPPTAGAPTSDSGSVFGAFSVGHLAMHDGTLTYRSGSAGRTTRVVIQRLTIAAASRAAPIDVAFRGMVEATPVDVEATLGAFDLLMKDDRQYPVKLGGEIGGRKVALVADVNWGEHLYRADHLEATLAGNTVKGDIAVNTAGQRPSVTFDLAADTWSMDEAPGPPPAPAKRKTARDNTKAKAVPTAAKSSGGESQGGFFTQKDVDFAKLRMFDARGDLAIGKLVFANGRTAERVRTHVSLVDGRAEFSGIQAAMLGGTLTGNVTIDAARENATRIAVRGQGKDLDLASLSALAGMPRNIKGGKTQIDADLALAGDSPRDWARTVNGQLTAIVGPATLPHVKGDAPDLLNKLADALNPFRGVDAATELTCAVVRLPLTGGVAKIDRTIAFESKKVGVLASGVVDLRDESLDLAFKINPREGIPIDVARFSDLVRLRGPLRSPAMVLDEKGAATTIARLGAAYATGGLSMLGESLLARGTAGGECDAALGKSAPPPARNEAPAPAPAASPIDELAKSIGRLLNR
jgi:uncharacterized protein involved in outer membrane biogenesis